MLRPRAAQPRWRRAPTTNRCPPLLPRGTAAGLALGAAPIALFIVRRVGVHFEAAPVGQLAVLAAFVVAAGLVSATAPTAVKPAKKA